MLLHNQKKYLIIKLGKNYYKDTNEMKYIDRTKIVGLIMIIALLIFCAWRGIEYRKIPVISLSIENVTVRQDEVLPEFQVTADYEQEDAIQEVEELAEELNQGKGYTITQNADISAEGNYTIELELEDALQKQLTTKWRNKLRVEVTNGSITVLNKYGDWEGTKFLKVDGSYASGWNCFGTATYYFDEDGNCVTGKQEIAGRTYYFGEDGKFDEQKNSINPAKPMLALTFDDGPGKYTETLLEQLETCNAKATFFLLGIQVEQFPEAVQKMTEIGCELGNHTTNHRNLTKITPEEIQWELEGTNQALEQIVGQRTTMIRPPYGAINDAVKAVLDTPYVLWDVDTLDWKYKDAAYVRDYVLSQAKDGRIILMHDIYETTVQAMAEVIPQLVEQGYQLVTVSELMSVKGVTCQKF